MIYGKWYTDFVDIKKDTWKSHVLLPRQLLKPYAFKVQNKGKYVNILDLKSNEIKQEKINNLDAELKYYNKDTENYLDEKIENPFARTINTINNLFVKENNGIIFKRNDLINIRKFFQYSFLRNPEFYKQFCRKVTDKTNKSIPVNFNHSELLGLASILDKVFQDIRIFIILNEQNGENKFVTPRSVVFELDSCIALKTGQIITLFGITINPNVVLCIVPFQSKTDHVDVIKLEDKDVQQINENIYSFELNRKNDVKYLVGKENDLLKLKKP